MYWPWTYSAQVYLRHTGAVKNDDTASRQVGCQKKNKKPRQVNLGNTDLISPFLLSLLEMGLRYEKRRTTWVRYQSEVVCKSSSKQQNIRKIFYLVSLYVPRGFKF